MGPVLRNAAVCAALLVGMAAGAARAQIYPLSNTPVAYAEAYAFFDLGGGGLVAVADGNALGIHVSSRVWSGRSGGALEGVYLYDYLLDDAATGTGAGEDLRSFGLPIAGRVDFDLDSDGADDSSAYCTDCTTSPVPTVPFSAFLDSSGIHWTFPFGIAGGDFGLSADLYFLSDRGPVAAQGRVELFGVGFAPIDVLPEPAGGALAALTSVAALGARSRARARA